VNDVVRLWWLARTWNLPGGLRPGYDGNERDAHDDGALDLVGHEVGRDKSAEEYSDPELIVVSQVAPFSITYSGICHLVTGAHARVTIKVLRRASGNVGGRGDSSTGDGANAGGIRQADEREKEANAAAACDLDGLWQHADQPLPHSNEGQENEDEAFNEDGSKRLAISEPAGAVEADHLVSEVGIEAHAGTAKVSLCTTVWAVTCARATGRFVKKPNRKDESPAMTAVAVIKSRLMSRACQSRSCYDLITYLRHTRHSLWQMSYCSCKSDRWDHCTRRSLLCPTGWTR
jgi:hypothetical protein